MIKVQTVYSGHRLKKEVVTLLLFIVFIMLCFLYILDMSTMLLDTESILCV